MKPATKITLLFLGLFSGAWADEPLWTEQERLEQRDAVLVGSVISEAKLGKLDDQQELHMAVFQVDSVKKGENTSKGSKVYVYYEFSALGRCPRYPELKAGDKGTLFLVNLTDAHKKSFGKLKTREASWYLEMGSDFIKEPAKQSAVPNRKR